MQSDLYQLLVATARQQLFLRQTYSRVLAQRERSWARLRQEGVDRMEELADVLRGKQRLNRVELNSRLQASVLSVTRPLIISCINYSAF